MYVQRRFLGETRLKPLISCYLGVTCEEWSGRGSNPRPQHCERCALPVELPPPVPPFPAERQILLDVARFCNSSERFPSRGHRSGMVNVYLY